MTTETAQRVYDGLPEFYRLVDPDNGNAMLALVRSLVEGMGVAQVDEDLDRLPGVLLDAQEDAPIEWIEWLAPLLGVEFNPSFSEDRRRSAVASTTSGWRSGTVPALEDAVRAGIRPHHADGTYVLVEGTGYYTSPTTIAPADIDLRVRSDAHHGTDEMIVDLRQGAAGSETGISLRAVGGTGGLALDIGTATATATVDVPFGQFDVGWVQIETEDSGADKVVTFSTSPEGAELSWTQLGDPITLAGLAGPIDFSGVDTFGVAGPDQIHSGARFVEVILLDGSGTEIAHFDPTDEEVGTSPILTDGHGHSWEASGDASIDQYPDDPFVEIVRHYGGNPWVIGVITSRKESPSDTSIVANAIEEARSRPAGFSVVFVDYSADWDTIEAGRPTWNDWEAADTWADVQSTT